MELKLFGERTIAQCSTHHNPFTKPLVCLLSKDMKRSHKNLEKLRLKGQRCSFVLKENDRAEKL